VQFSIVVYTIDLLQVLILEKKYNQAYGVLRKLHKLTGLAVKILFVINIAALQL